jgi:NADH dehydrogenase
MLFSTAGSSQRNCDCNARFSNPEILPEWKRDHRLLLDNWQPSGKHLLAASSLHEFGVAEFHTCWQHGRLDPVLIIGGGYAGLTAAIDLCKLQLPVILVSQNESFLHLVRLHKTIYRKVSDYEVSLARLGQLYGFSFIQARADINPAALKQAGQTSSFLVNDRLIHFSSMILACGAAPAARIQGAMDLLDLASGKAYLKLQELVASRQPASFVVGGGGATGLQLLFELHDFLKGMRFPFQLALVDLSDRLLSEFPASFHEYIASRLNKLGIQYYPSSRISSFKDNRLTLEGKATVELPCDICFFMPGVKPLLQCQANEFGQVVAEQQVYPNIFAAGDMARFPSGMDGLYAQAAVRKARLVVQNIQNAREGIAPAPYSYQSLGAFVSLGFWDGIGWLLAKKQMVTGVAAFALKEAIEAQYKLYLGGLDTYLEL